MTICLACGAGVTALPIPNPLHSVLSDGRVFAQPLAKAYCATCGLVQHRVVPTPETVRAFYDDSYDLAAEVAPSDIPRSNGYADVLMQVFADVAPSRVLEVGCGAGHILHVLADTWQGAEFTGYEAAPAVARAAHQEHERIAVHQGFAEELPVSETGFDLVFSVNVFEHAADPVRFLQAKARQLAPDGRAVVICPAACPPNLELVFMDHIHSFTPQAVARLAQKAGLHLIRHDPHPDWLGDFQLFVFGGEFVSSPSTLCLPEGSALNAISLDMELPGTNAISAYLEGWQRLDAELLARTQRAAQVQLFGAGEMAALIRAYAPRTWTKVNALLVDDVSGARALGLPVLALPDAQIASEDIVIIATHPRGQQGVAKRLTQAGVNCVTFSDILPG